MARYHAVSYETEARIRQDEKLANARRHRPRAAPLVRRMRYGLHVVVGLLVTGRM